MAPTDTDLPREDATADGLVGDPFTAPRERPRDSSGTAVPPLAPAPLPPLIESRRFRGSTDLDRPDARFDDGLFPGLVTISMSAGVSELRLFECDRTLDDDRFDRVTGDAIISS